jgi:hypothetical protein
MLSSMILPQHPQVHFHCRSVPLTPFPIYLYASLGWYIIYEAPRSRMNDHLHSRYAAAILPSLHQQYLMTYAASVILYTIISQQSIQQTHNYLLKAVTKAYFHWCCYNEILHLCLNLKLQSITEAIPNFKGAQSFVFKTC